MMQKIFLLLLVLLLFFGIKGARYESLGDISESGFRRLMEREWAREVFDLETEEAVEVFGEQGETYFL